MTLAARATSRLKLGPGVTNPLTRHAAVTASAISSIQEASDGRAMLGIGRGDSSLFNIGHKPVPPGVFERYVSDLQTYLSGGSLQAGDYASRLHWTQGNDITKVPIDVGATGPKVIGIGARLAERVSFSLGSNPERLAWGMDRAREAVGAEGKMPSFGAYLNVCVHDDVSRAAELVRPGVGIFAHFTSMTGASVLMSGKETTRFSIDWRTTTRRGMAKARQRMRRPCLWISSGILPSSARLKTASTNEDAATSWHRPNVHNRPQAGPFR